ncbi:hypothetical protein PLICRDRAFT_36310 [Plicaturopsis crispa FD-325 SS-3]|nr:hypothetical protein PLICRDRAFT_36310 [Plicaturopsis crispa FD-325 SS-3]
MARPRILLIDSYDSFTYNLASLCRQSIDCEVHIIKNDALTTSELLPHLPYFDAVVVGPGPGSPENPQDVGLVKDLWEIKDNILLPIFGVCLGLQSLAIEFGAVLKRLSVVKHGQISLIQHEGTDIFQGVGNVEAVRYHSLHVQLAEHGDVEALAWADDGAENGRVLMAARHKSKPFWAVQYHPESVRTDGGGLEVVQNFWKLASHWSQASGRSVKQWDDDAEEIFGQPWPHMHALSSPPTERGSLTVETRILGSHALTPPIVCELFGVSNESSPFVLLDSASHPGRFSIIASLLPSSSLLSYFVGDAFVAVTADGSTSRVELGSQDIWTWLASFVRKRRARGGSSEIPFWGGLIGYLGYEVGVASIPVPIKRDNPGNNAGRHPDVNLVFVERSVVLDLSSGRAYVQSIIPSDNAWLDHTISLLTQAAETFQPPTNAPREAAKYSPSDSPSVTLPDKDLYIARINQAKEHLFAGDSYELCLTAGTRVSVKKPPPSQTQLPSPSTSWDLYQTLRKNNPAPHSAYIRLHPTTILCSSPERFLSFSRPPHSVCQLRPIKGTVRKAPGITRAVAEEALAGSAKEVAENLMIVDLIRHDLHGVLGEDVAVTQFCKVEEYETVWQLVSVIEGRAPHGFHVDSDGEMGWEVLRRSLPPGSMTGAPKKRSVEILQTLEDGERSVYSGVLGYWDVGGGGDWSVIIRSCFKHDNPAHNGSADTDEWVIGAGGAITALSDADAEWDEMLVKLQSALKAFGAHF